MTVDYIASARRHLKDARILLAEQRQANAGQLLGFSVECGLKALLLACGIVPDADGGIPAARQAPDGKVYKKSSYREHMPMLNSKIVSLGNLLPDGQRAIHYHAMLPSINCMTDWSVDQRYWKDEAVKSHWVQNWQLAANEINLMLDHAIVDGVMK
jgi:hypothetical protein